jgi:hypothetical protein
VDDHTEELVKWFYDSTPVRDVKQQLCVELIGACTEIVDWSDEEAAEKRGEAVKLHRASEEKHKRREAKKAAKKAKLEAEDKARKEADEKAANQESTEVLQWPLILSSMILLLALSMWLSRSASTEPRGKPRKQQ